MRRGNHRVKRHVVVQGNGIDRRVDLAALAGEQCRKRRCEPETARHPSQVQRLDPQPVPRQHQSAAVALQDGDGEHPVQVLDEVRSPCVVRLEDDLRVPVGEEAIPLVAQRCAQLAVVVHGPVVRDREAKIAVHHRLLGVVAEVEDLQPTLAQRRMVPQHQAGAVRAPARHRRRHTRQHRSGRQRTVPTQFTTNAAHDGSADARGGVDRRPAERVPDRCALR